ncbi:ApoD5 [Ramazzottius varieornatus]|uniref:ApoD5 n=1 Tax=Ramazzottius varieornatus TaxID=947166 RepID=A0A1D1VC15_RAMVA|nr:ApoD5 [Ramazzottius varieornatus]
METRMITAYLLAVVVLLSCNKAEAQVGRVGKCPDYQGLQDFSFERYANGTWYEVAKFFTVMETKCVAMEFVPHNGTILVVSTALEKMILPPPVQQAPPPPAQLRHSKHGGFPLMSHHDKKLVIEHLKAQRTRRNINQAEPIFTPVKVVGFVSEKVPPATLRFNYTEGTSMQEYRVLDTDYETYATIWSCTEMFNGVFHNQFVSILSRTRTVEPSLINELVAKLTAAGLETSHLVVSDQQRCDS